MLIHMYKHNQNNEKNVFCYEKQTGKLILKTVLPKRRLTYRRHVVNSRRCKDNDLQSLEYNLFENKKLT